jgi:hypothetical protein
MTPEASRRQRGVGLREDPLPAADQPSAPADGRRPPDIDTLQRQTLHFFHPRPDRFANRIQTATAETLT